MGWQKYLVLIRQYKNRSIIKDHFIFKDRQYQKHKVEYKKIVFFFFNKCDLIKAVTLSHNSKHDLKKNEIWHHKHIAHRVRSQHARSVELEVALTGAAQAQGAFCFLWGREGRERDCEGNTHSPAAAQRPRRQQHCRGQLSWFSEMTRGCSVYTQSTQYIFLFFTK